MTVKDNGIFQAPNDRICNAIVMSTPTYTNPQSLVGTYTKHYLQNQNNFCADAEGDPAACWSNNENDKTVWYKLPSCSPRSMRYI
ncbi:MAG: hypothetical protein IPJ22_05720 [Bacteroidetes bacterium]|nr:hypothetical protein [Bacteroidota bacterium]